MASEKWRVIEKRIRQLKRRLADTGNMRPGTLGVQYRNPAERKIPFHQISYTHKGRSHSEYVRPVLASSLRSVSGILALSVDAQTASIAS